jgi:hypothetical protein
MNRINADFERDTHKSPRQLEREIDATRAELQATLEELEYRLSPTDLLGQFWTQFRRHGGEFGENLGQSLKDNPMPALLTTIGIAWMMAASGRHHNGNGAMHYRRGEGGARLREGRERLRESGYRMRERFRDARESMRHSGESAREGVGEARDKMSSTAHAVGDRARSTAHTVGDRARSMSAEARYRARRARAGFGNLLEEQPLLLGAIGLAAGVIAGAALPPTEQEDRAFGPARDRALDRARRAGAEGARQVRERTEEVVETAKDAMQQHDGERRSSEQHREQRVASGTPSETSTSSPSTGLRY